ncbi:hypothetical protein F511_23342 [Dorcoceras hygrometricum]|uniref:Knottins-like domain-containing protein n=1 Tax=Dorcoceras hygrometricum TaxID=472368 RepID=A0A2Z7CYA4_9LAMI|nr:hypothetical protein F511_23342 [Dorcoceras hygrometricum]
MDKRLFGFVLLLIFLSQEIRFAHAKRACKAKNEQFMGKCFRGRKCRESCIHQGFQNGSCSNGDVIVRHVMEEVMMATEAAPVVDKEITVVESEAEREEDLGVEEEAEQPEDLGVEEEAEGSSMQAENLGAVEEDFMEETEDLAVGAVEEDFMEETEDLAVTMEEKFRSIE